MKILVTGATGFLGGRVVDKLLESNDYQVIATGRDKSKAEKLKEKGATVEVGSLEDRDFLESITKDVEVIVHSAALSSPWGKYQDFYNANIFATRNIVEASKTNNVRRIVHVSTPSIYFDYTDRFNIKEDFLPAKFVNHYAETKYKAEKVIDEAFAQGIETISLRPRAIVGAGDTTIMPRLLKAQTQGRLKIIGDGENIVDVTSVSNVVDSIILSIHAEKKALGEKYNITNGEPVKLWELIEDTFKGLDLTLNKKKIPFKVAYNFAKALEFASSLTSSYKEPVLTCYGVGVLATAMTMNIDKAKNLLNYHPKQTNKEAVEEFIAWWKTQK
jgi:nucleoside-diphosphate-sugar epimerase